MNKVQLFIENEEIELNKDVQFSITRQYEEIINPTVIINDYTKTVSIPFTEHNNNVFGHIYHPDKMTVFGDDDTIPSVGIYFNPLKKLDFRLVWNGDILMQGYAKMNKVNRTATGGTYEITLNGELGKLFQEMKLITFDKNSVNGKKYIIKGEDYVDDYITKDLVAASWNKQQTRIKLEKKYSGIRQDGTPIPNINYSIHNVIGFAPNMAYDEEFNYKTFQQTENTSHSFSESLDGVNFYDNTGIESDTVLEKGMTPRGIGEFRSYMQLPYIYFNKLFQIFQKKAESVTGYQFDLSSSWFNDNNPYWKDLVFMLKKLDADKGDIFINNYDVRLGSIYWGGTLRTYTTTQTAELNPTKDYSEETIPIVNWDASPLYFELDNKTSFVSSSVIRFGIQATAKYNGSTREDFRIHKKNSMRLHINAVGNNGHIYKRNYLICDKDYEGDTEGYYAVYKFDNGENYNGYYTRFNFDIPIDISFTQLEFGDGVRLTVSAEWETSEYAPFMTVKTLSYSDYYPNATTVINETYIMSANVSKNAKMSNVAFTLNELWDNDYNLFTEILNYCKMYRIAIKVDEYNKKLKFLPLVEYFSDYDVVDWTDKISIDKSILLQPITFENKFVLYNYKDNETDLGEQYFKTYGINYAEKRLITDYNFNTETENLFENDITPSMTYTDNVLSWTTLYENKKIYYTFGSEIYVYSSDKDGKFVDNFGSYYFRDGFINFDTSGDLRNVVVSDDTIFQQSNNTYFYSQNVNSVSVTKYPHLDIVKGNNLCVFTVPMENYTYLSNYSGKKGIYENFWSDYVEERYSIQNKIVTCYVYINPSDYINFDWNKFIRIQDQLYMINKIYDYDCVSNQKVKVDLVTIQDTNGYTENEFSY